MKGKLSAKTGRYFRFYHSIPTPERISFSVGCLQAVVHTLVPVEALLNQGMNANFASDAKVSLALGFKNTRKEDSYLKSATPKSDIPHIFIYFYVFL
ncbi:MAG: hypothetical protein O9295_14460 [Microcystis sp. LE18-22.4A]|uniref:hypothetical protein n=1 Tax=Microcystis sp. LE18-22.4A TaxID=3016432 RepID=UPI0022CBB7A2|nr:hypothetical protein [Microcystis sp. LE18-22.4A]MCZ8119221.1 hypothetical protein [Microcystis sp. LE18-22.4A]